MGTAAGKLNRTRGPFGSLGKAPRALGLLAYSYAAASLPRAKRKDPRDEGARDGDGERER